MTKLIYETIRPIDQMTAKEAFDSGDLSRIQDALIRSALYIDDWRWVQDYCLDFLYGTDEGLQELAAVSLGHLARIHGILDLDKVNPILAKLRNNPHLNGVIDDTIEDIQTFIV